MSGASASKSKQSAASGTSSHNAVFPQQQNALTRLWRSYQETTPTRLKLIDAWLVFVMMTGIIQFAYVIPAGTYPYNAFLSGFGASVGSFVLAANLRIQSNPKNAEEFGNQSPERSFADFVILSIIFYGFVVNFIG